MDAVKEGQTALLEVFDQWAGEAPTVISDEERFTEWAQDGPALIEALGALSPFQRITGTGATGQPHVRTSTRGPAGRRTASGNGTVTDEQIVDALATPMNKTQLAEHLGVSRQTIDRKLDRLVKERMVTAQGEGSQKKWRARAAVPA